jgi:hypothetical protein
MYAGKRERNDRRFRPEIHLLFIDTVRINLLETIIKTIIGAVNKCLKRPAQGAYGEFF